MKVDFLDEARAEMNEAARFYEDRQSALGVKFLDAIERAVDDIENNPRRWPSIFRHVRRRLVGRFPYGVLYRIDATEIMVVAIMHPHRHPKYWTKRLGSKS